VEHRNTNRQHFDTGYSRTSLIIDTLHIRPSKEHPVSHIGLLTDIYTLTRLHAAEHSSTSRS
jgi:hypothetical protein